MRNRTLRLVTPAVLAASLLAVGGLARAAEDAPDPGVYIIDATLAPVCLDGQFPVTIETAPGPNSGTLTLTTDIRGKLAGTLAIAGGTFEVTGRASSTSKGFRVTMTARSGREHIAFSGSLAGTLISGTAKGNDDVVSGKNLFSIDVSAASPQVATLVANLAAGKRGALTGTATATVCGAPLALSVKGSPGRQFKLTFSAKGFKFTGKGTGPIEWRCSGFGANVGGENLPLAALPAPSSLAYGVAAAVYEEEEPIGANFPTTFMPRFTTFGVAPALPQGLAIDAATGVITGTPVVAAAAGNYAVTATNPAGSTQAVLSLSVRVNRSRSFAAETESFDDDDLRHFLRRTQFGVRTAELDALRTGGLPAYLDAMLVFPATTQAETDANALLVSATDPAGDFPSTNAVARWWTQLMVRTPAPFQETLAFFWHDHFGVSSAQFDSSERRWVVTHVNLLRRNGNGNLRTLLLDVARDPAMLKFLDGVQNTRSRPNENFGREFWELFTLGVDNGYTQTDITEAARALTGYREVFDAATGLNNVVLDLASRHDTGAKSVLGQTIAAQNLTDDYEQLVDITLARGRVAEFITKKLFEYFCYENPPQALVDTMAANLRAGNYEIAPFLKALFSSEAFFSKKSRRNLVKSPVEFTLGFLRSTGLTMTTSSATAPAFDVNSLDASLTNQAQRPTQPPTVDGWPQGDLWLAAQGMVERINVIHVCVDDTTDQNRLGINVQSLLPPVAQRTAEAVVDTLSQLLDVQLSTQDRADLVTYLNTVRDVNGNVTASAFDGSIQAHLDERVRGLIYALAQHPTYHSR